MNAKSCFVIMPFSKTKSCREDEWTDVFDTVFRPAAENCGYSCWRAQPVVGNIVRGILEDLCKSHLILADLTDRNPNVYYELGIRHALKTRTILVSQTRDDIPFDLKAYANHVYSRRTQRDKDDAIRQLGGIITQLDTGSHRSDNPVDDFLASDPEFAKSLFQGLVATRTDQFTWGEYWEAVDTLRDTISKPLAYGGWRPNLIVGISRGGAALADFLSGLLGDVPFMSLWADRDRTTDPRIVEFGAEVNPFNKLNIADIVRHFERPRRILLVDDYCKTGASLSAAKKHLEDALIGIDHDGVRTAVMATKAGCKRCIEPDYCVHRDTEKDLLPYWRG